MGAGFVILFWLGGLAVLGAIWAVLAGAAILGWVKKIAWLKWGAGIPAVLMLVGGLLIGGFIVWGAIDSTNPKSVFTSTFGAPPSPAITDLESSVFWFADTGSVYLRFRTSEEEFRKLVPEGLAAKSAEEAKRAIPLENEAQLAWWNFKYAAEWRYFVRVERFQEQPGKHGFFSETEYIAYDPASGFVYYRFLGID